MYVNIIKYMTATPNPHRGDGCEVQIIYKTNKKIQKSTPAILIFSLYLQKIRNSKLRNPAGLSPQTYLILHKRPARSRLCLSGHRQGAPFLNQ